MAHSKYYDDTRYTCDAEMREHLKEIENRYGEFIPEKESPVLKRNLEWEAYVDSLPQQDTNKYIRTVKGVSVDVYDVLKGFNVTCPAMQHALKKMLCSGLRGHKGSVQDKEEAIASIKRSIELDG
jgi:hypothetical protein